jgi:clan AA aspartic protease (TIGR02281 family)
MRRIYIIYTLLLLLLPFITFSQCISGDCENGQGVSITKNKDRIEGTWKNGKLEGKVKIEFASGDKYEGQMLDDKKNGVGKYTFKNGSFQEGKYINDTLTGIVSIKNSNGDKYAGYWKNGKRNGAGKFEKLDGYFEEGKYINDQLNGYATIVFSNKGKFSVKYVGYMNNGVFEGNGVYYYANGDKFEGNWKGNKENGPGTYYYQKGGTLKGIWNDGVFISGSDASNKTDTLNTIIPILNNGGVYEVNATLNGVLKLDLIFDTGASEIVFTQDIFRTLLKTKTISDEDNLEGREYMDANGNINLKSRFNLKNIKIGNITIENVPCAVSKNIDGPNLLGLSAIKKLGKFEFDFNQTIIKVK